MEILKSPLLGLVEQRCWTWDERSKVSCSVFQMARGAWGWWGGVGLLVSFYQQQLLNTHNPVVWKYFSVCATSNPHRLPSSCHLMCLWTCWWGGLGGWLSGSPAVCQWPETCCLRHGWNGIYWTTIRLLSFDFLGKKTGLLPFSILIFKLCFPFSFSLFVFVLKLLFVLPLLLYWGLCKAFFTF